MKRRLAVAGTALLLFRQRNPAGAGIVAEGDPASEYQETLRKAQGLLKAIEITEGRVSE
jgi:anthranilate/para-aminobenzoate synthase component I